jgi:cysteine desulfurase family protein (TIGR01976 family)
MAMMSSSVFESVRERFPALRAAGDREVFFDNAAGAQVPDEVVDAVREHYTKRNVQRGGHYALSRAVDEGIADARRAIASFLNASSPREIVFGLNSTSLIRMTAEALRPRFKKGDRVIVTELDHEANIGAWLRLESSGVEPVVWHVAGGDAGRLDLDGLAGLLRAGAGRVRLVALPLASNATGRIVDVAAAARLAHEAGALVFVDAVHYGPHGLIDVQALNADFLAFSGYKIFGPHIGFLWGRADQLRTLEPARDFFIPAEAPYAFEPGTQSYEAIAGMAAALRYLASLDGSGSLRRAMAHIRGHEAALSTCLLEQFRSVPGMKIYGDADPASVEARVPTFAFRVEGRTCSAVVETLASLGIHARDGHMYAPRLVRALGLDPEDGVCRVSLCHYNTPAEIAWVAETLRAMT